MEEKSKANVTSNARDEYQDAKAEPTEPTNGCGRMICKGCCEENWQR